MIKIICVGKIKEKYLTDLISDYLLRISKYHKVEIVELKDSNIKKESLEILESVKQSDYNVLLDINGEEFTSLEFANFISNVFTNVNGRITFIIGGSNGVDDSVKKIVQKRISFSHLTFPHGLFRGILLEQLYRSFKILNNESYHK
jgi:23S rRNA (pseudouridine1915-N3)-methyltransferase